MRVVLDANIFISFLLTRGGTIASLFDSWEEGKFTLLVTEEIILEITQVIERFVGTGFILPQAGIALLRRLKKNAEVVESLSYLKISPDKKDNRYLACAKDGKADFLVTGDKKHLLFLKKIGQTKILSPQEFLQTLSSSKTTAC